MHVNMDWSRCNSEVSTPPWMAREIATMHSPTTKTKGQERVLRRAETPNQTGMASIRKLNGKRMRAQNMERVHNSSREFAETSCHVVAIVFSCMPSDNASREREAGNHIVLWCKYYNFCWCSHIHSQNQVRGHGTDFSHSGAEQYPRDTHKETKSAVHAYIIADAIHASARKKYKSEIGSQPTMYQVHTGTYV